MPKVDRGSFISGISLQLFVGSECCLLEAGQLPVSLEGVVCLLDTFMQMFDLDAIQTALLAHVAAENRKQGGKRSYKVDCSKFAEAAEKKNKEEGEQHDDTM